MAFKYLKCNSYQILQEKIKIQVEINKINIWWNSIYKLRVCVNCKNEIDKAIYSLKNLCKSALWKLSKAIPLVYRMVLIDNYFKWWWWLWCCKWHANVKHQNLARMITFLFCNASLSTKTFIIDKDAKMN